ncbi:MAG: glycoside hydrolase family 9 protein, partial [Acidimicrobiales bacterium]
MGGASLNGRDGVLRFLFGVLALLLVLVTSGACSGDPDRVSQSQANRPAGQIERGADPGSRETAGPSPVGRWTRESPIRVDQFGYRPGDPKWAVLVDPELGFNDNLDYEPTARIEVRRTGDDAVVLSATPIAWEQGRVHEQSGDRGWWLDFSEVREPGSYYLADVDGQVESAPFEIADDVYDGVLETALQVFWYNRGNVAHPEDLAGPWTDDAAFVGPGQDTEARWVDDRSNPDTALDLSGGWFDAGDTNKYVTFASEPVHQLLAAYRRAPQVFDDDLGIPESGNGLPDLIDEIRWEMDWLERMQQPDGGVLV